MYNSRYLRGRYKVAGVIDSMSKQKIDLMVHRPHILVSDHERAFELYCGILGFKVDRVADALSVTYDMFGCDEDKTKLRVAFLSDSKTKFGAIAVTEMKGQPFPAPQPPYPMNIIIEVSLDTLEDKVMQFRERGLYTSEPYVIIDTPPPRTDWVVSDYDGHRICLFAMHSHESGRSVNVKDSV